MNSNGCSMKEEEVNRCQIQEWYPKFKSVSIKTEIHELPESFIDYLTDDFAPFVLPVSVTNEDALPNRIRNPLDEQDLRISETSNDNDQEEEELESRPSFPALELKIKESIESLGGAVFPKLNWSSPKDSVWISTSGTLRCTTFSEIVLLLRSSDSLVHDLCHAYDACSDQVSSRPRRFFLALRKWYSSLSPEMEFRCFVHNRRLAAISQRDVSAFYPVLLEKKADIKKLIENFFLQHLKMKFQSDNYTFDVYVTGDMRVKLIDFNPWCAFTLPLLFTWEELERINGEEEEDAIVNFRVVEDRCGIRPGLKSAVPHDLLDLSPGSGWDQAMKMAHSMSM